MRQRLVLLLLLLATVNCLAQIGTATNIRHGSTLPTNCLAGDIFFKTSAPIGVWEGATAGSPCTWRYIGGTSIGTCEVLVGDTSSTSSPLNDDSDSPNVCKNDSGGDWTILYVTCFANAGSPTVNPILTGGSSTSILTGNLTCGTSSPGAAGTVNGSPVIHSTSGSGATCTSTPCTIDANIVSAGGTARYIEIAITYAKAAH